MLYSCQGVLFIKCYTFVLLHLLTALISQITLVYLDFTLHTSDINMYDYVIGSFSFTF